MKEMPLLSSPVSTTVAALRQYWRCLMPVPASPLAYTDGWRCLLSRTTQVTEDQSTCREVKTGCPPGGSPVITQAPGLSPDPLYRHPFRQPIQAETG